MNLGQVYTKDIVADFMVSLIDLPKDAYIVDPCFGRGVFVKSLQKENFTNITGVEIDPETFNLIDFDDYTGKLNWLMLQDRNVPESSRDWK